MAALWLQIVDPEYQPLPLAEVLSGDSPLEREDDRWVGHADPGQRLTLHATAEGFEPETHHVTTRERKHPYGYAPRCTFGSILLREPFAATTGSSSQFLSSASIQLWGA